MALRCTSLHPAAHPPVASDRQPGASYTTPVVERNDYWLVGDSDGPRWYAEESRTSRHVLLVSLTNNRCRLMAPAQLEDNALAWATRTRLRSPDEIEQPAQTAHGTSRSDRTA